MKARESASFFQDFIKSIKNFEFYKIVKDEKNSNTIKYFCIIIAIYSIISAIGIMYTLVNTINNTKDFINNEIESIEYSNGILSVNNNNYKSLINGLIIIDTGKSDNSEYENVATIVFGKEYCSIKMENNIFKLRYNDYFYEDINKDDVINFISNIGIKYYIIIAIIAFFFEIIVLLISTIIDVLIIAMIGYIMSRIIRNETLLNFSQVFKISVHAITLPIVLAMIYYIINIFSGFYIKYFSIMYTSIAVIYIMTSIILIASDNDKKNINMQK